jgi:hypothetical protein
MLKALRIASIGAVIFSAAVLAAVALAGFRGDAEIEEFLAREGVVEQFRKKSQTIPAKTDAISPLEQAAKSFALRIDPPPPPPPPKPVEPPKPVVKPPVAQPALPKLPEDKQPTLSAKFTLVATARYPEHPEKSMALLKNVQNQYKWYRRGDSVGHLEIREIKDGSIVLYQGGKFNSELFMPAPPTVPSLLKSDAQASAASRSPTLTIGQLEAAGETGAEQPSGSSAPSAPGRTRPSIQPPASTRTVRSSPRIGSVSTSEQAPTVEMSPQEQIRSIEESISAIESIMRQSPPEEKPVEEQQAEQAAWQELLKVLEKEKEELLRSARPNQPTEETVSREESVSQEEKTSAPSESAGSEGPETSESSEKNQ